MTHKMRNKLGKGFRQPLALLISLVLLCGLVMPAYASEAETTPATVPAETVAVTQPASADPAPTQPETKPAETQETAPATQPEETQAEETQAGENLLTLPNEEAPAEETNVQKVQKMIDALPTLEEYNAAMERAESSEEGSEEWNQAQAYSDQIGAAMEAYMELTEEEQTQVDATKLMVFYKEAEDGVDTLINKNEYTYTATGEPGDSKAIQREVRTSKKTSIAHVYNSDGTEIQNPGFSATPNENKSEKKKIKIEFGNNVPAGTYYVDLVNQDGTYKTRVVVTGDGSGGSTTTSNKRVLVYVAAKDENGNPFSQEMLELLGISYVNQWSYFPAGEVVLPDECLAGSNQDALADSNEKWNMIINAIKTNGIVTSDLDSTAAGNKEHKLVDYADQIKRDLNYPQAQQKSALFASGSPDNMITKKCDYHLDLRFSCNRIIFKTGNNGIKDGAAADGTEIDNRVYITGSIIQEPRGGVTPPAGYRVVEGYYSDADFQTPWNGIGTPLNEDQIVYVKIVPYDNVVINYKVATGAESGSVDPDFEGLNPVTGVATGSTATPADGWRFDGWYAEEACSTKLSDDAKFVPQKPDGDWVDGTTYWAKFVRAVTDVTISKTVTGGLGDRSKAFSFTVTVKLDDKDQKFKVNGEEQTSPYTFTLSHGDSVKLTDVPIGATVTVTEEDYGTDKGGYTTTNDCGEGRTATWVADANGKTIAFTNHKDANPDTGVLLDSMPYVLILAAVVAGAALMLLRKRRNRTED